MKSLNKFSLYRMSKILICLTLILLCFGFRSYMFTYDILAEINFRTYGSTVKNHNLYIQSQYTGNPNNATSSPYPLTNTSCVAVHSGTLSNLDPIASATTNRLEVTPSTANNYADYANGLDAIDLVRGRQGALGVVPFTNGYQALSLDVQNDNDADTFDVKEIQKLILGTITSFNRNSWEWMDAAHIASIGAGTFLANPWHHTLGYLCTGTLVVNGVSRNQIANGTAFSLRTTKIGDIEATSHSGENTWTCTNGTYFKQEQVESRSNQNANSPIPASSGSEIIANINLKRSESIYGIEIPIHINHNFFDVKAIRFDNGFEPEWYFNKANDRLTIIMVDSKANEINVQNGNIAYLSLVSKVQIADIRKEITFSNDRQVLIIDNELKLADATISLNFDNVISNSLEARIIHSISGAQLEANLPQQTVGEIQILNLNGQIIHRMKENFSKGINRMNIPFIEGQSIKILHLTAGSEKLALKYIN